MAQELILMFDSLGAMWEVDNPTEMLGIMGDEELLPIYKSTVYEHRLCMAIEELISKGYLQDNGTGVYNEPAGQRGIDLLETEVIERHGVDNQKKIISEIDLRWEANKPDIPTRKKKKK